MQALLLALLPLANQEAYVAGYWAGRVFALVLVFLLVRRLLRGKTPK